MKFGLWLKFFLSFSLQTFTMESRKQNRSLFCQCLTFFLILLRKLYDLLCDTIFAFIFNSVEVKKVPPIRNSLLRESAVSLAEKIRNQEVNHFVVLILKLVTKNLIFCILIYRLLVKNW